MQFSIRSETLDAAPLFIVITKKGPFKISQDILETDFFYLNVTSLFF